MAKFSGVLAGILPIILLVLLAGAVMLPKLGSLVPSTTPREQPSSLHITQFESLVEDPFFLPERVLQAGLVFTHHEKGTYLRLVSVALGGISLLLLYWLLSRWHTRRVAILSVIMLATSSWFLHQSRWAEPNVLYLSAIPALLIGVILLKKKRYDRLWPLTVFVFALLLYLPGLWALIALFAAFNFVKIRKTFQYLSTPYRLVTAVAFLVTITPLIYSFWRRPWLVSSWLGLPEGGLSIYSVFRNLYEIPKQLFVTGPDNNLLWLVGTPILDAATIALAVIGLYSYSKGLHPVRFRALIGLSSVSIALISLGGLVNLSLLIPLVYIFAANGIALLLQQWFTVFPRNPFARSIGIVIVVAIVAAACSYQLLRYYVAWPNAEATYNAFQKQSK